MRIPRFFISQSKIDDARPEPQLVLLKDKDIIHQILKVLRLGEGDHVDLLNGEGITYRCRIVTPGKNETVLYIEQEAESAGEPAIEVTVALPLLKSGRFEWAVEKLTEIGARKIVPLITERSVVKPKQNGSGRHDLVLEEINLSDHEKLNGKLKRWHSIAKEAAEQCERSLIPQVVAPVTLPDLLKATKSDEKHITLFAAERADVADLRDFLCNIRLDKDKLPMRVLLLIGPEGGWTKNEVELCSTAGVTMVGLGQRILRSETAGIYALSLIIALLDTQR